MIDTDAALGTPEIPDTPTQPDDFSMPEKFRDKPPEEIAKAYVEVEKLAGRVANEKGQLEQRLRELEARPVAQPTTPPPPPLPPTKMAEELAQKAAEDEYKRGMASGQYPQWDESDPQVIAAWNGVYNTQLKFARQELRIEELSRLVENSVVPAVSQSFVGQVIQQSGVTGVTQDEVMAQLGPDDLAFLANPRVSREQKQAAILQGIKSLAYDKVMAAYQTSRGGVTTPVATPLVQPYVDLFTAGAPPTSAAPPATQDVKALAAHMKTAMPHLTDKDALDLAREEVEGRR
jgi:hypothetical protein